MFSRICFVLVLVAATNASPNNRPIRQTTTGPAVRWTMYSTPTPNVLSPNSDSTNDPSNPDDSLLVIDLEKNSTNESSTKRVYISPKWEFSCPKRFGYYRFEQSCDIYVECRNYRPYRKLCPDGMHFKEFARWGEYPCGYPSEAPCLTRGGKQPARPTDQCPHQFGFYPITDKTWPIYERCNRYIVCASGVATMMNCSIGLAFNPAIGKCDWPDRVPECKDFLNFRCPIPPLGEEDMVHNYRYVTDPDCRYFFSCQRGLYKVLSCEDGLAFDANTGRCIDEELVQCYLEPYLEENYSTATPLDSGITFGYHSVKLV